MAANPSIQLGTDGNWAIKEDNLLAYKKDVTRFFNKEFDFTRGSLATFVDKDGLIKYSGVTDTELVTNGDFATDSDWTLGNGWSISGGKAILVDGLDPTYQIYQSISGLNTKNLKVTFDVTDFIGDAELRYPFRKSITGNGSYTFYGIGTLDRVQFQVKSGFTASFSIDNVSVQEIQTDVPRIDFTNDTTGHLLLEPQSTNLLTYSEDFSQWTLGSNSTLTYESNVVAPDGSLGVYKLTNPATSSTFIQSPSFSSSNPLTVSLYVKSTGSGNDNFNFYTGASNVSDLKTATSEWQRFDYTADGSSMYIINSGDTFTSDIYIWGAQAEVLSYATSYIPTNGSTATRNAEICNNSGSAQDFNSQEGVLYAEVAALNGTSATNRYISLSDGSVSNSILIKFGTGGILQLYNGGTSGTNTIYSDSSIDITKNIKIAIQYGNSTSDYKVFIDGVSKSVSGIFSATQITALNEIKFEYALNFSLNFFGKVKDLRYYDTALTDAELTKLTT